MQESPTLYGVQRFFSIKIIFHFCMERECLFRVVAIWQIRNDIFIKPLLYCFTDSKSIPLVYFESLDDLPSLYKWFFMQKILLILLNGDDSKYGRFFYALIIAHTIKKITTLLVSYFQLQQFNYIPQRKKFFQDFNFGDYQNYFFTEIFLGSSIFPNFVNIFLGSFLFKLTD